MYNNPMKILNREFLKVSTPTCHAGTIAFYQDEPIFAWFGGLMEGAPDSSIYVQCRGKTHRFGGKDNVAKWNPILYCCNDNLFLFVKSGQFCDRWNTFVLNISNIFDSNFDIYKVKTDILPAGLNGPVKTKPIDHKGLIFMGSSVETIYDWSSYVETYLYDTNSQSFVYVSRTSPLTTPKTSYNDPYGIRRNTLGIIQPSLWNDRNGNLNAFFRSSRGLGRIYYSHSEDASHELWENPKPTKFLNPNSGMDVVYKNGRLFLVYNPSDTLRFPLDLVELDEHTFEVIEEITIRDKVSESDKTYSPELSYPYVIDNNGKLHILYTYGRTKIEYCVVET